MITLILISVILTMYLVYIYRSYSYFKQLGIDGPQPCFFFGNVADFARTKRISISIHQWTKQFGKVFGYFEGHTPVLVISDPEILEKIFLKNFSKFHSRQQFPLEDRSVEKGVHLFSATGDDWHRQRTLLNRTFSPLKIKRMLPMMDECIAEFLIKLNQSLEMKTNEVEIYQLYKALTMDLIWQCCFGLKTDMQTNPTNPYLLRSQEVFARESSTYFTTLLAIFLPELQPLWLKLHKSINSLKVFLRQTLPFGSDLIADDPNEWLKENVDQIIAHGKENIDRMDLLHLMINSPCLSLNEVKENMYLFMTAGYETASAALAYVTYVLATHPEEQKKLRDLIDQTFESKDFLDADLINEIDYLDWFIRETLRIYPITPIVINRHCSERFDLPGLGTIEAGTKVTLDMYSLHNDPDLWGPVDPKKFYPERFATKRHRLAWLAFGAGPRNCIGMRFALMEIKLAIIRLLQLFEISPSDQIEENFQLIELVTIAPKQVRVRLERRKSSSSFLSLNKLM